MTLIEAVHAALRRMHYSPRTEEAYIHWIRAFVRFHERRCRNELQIVCRGVVLGILAVRRAHEGANGQVEPGRAILSLIVSEG